MEAVVDGAGAGKEREEPLAGVEIEGVAVEDVEFDEADLGAAILIVVLGAAPAAALGAGSDCEVGGSAAMTRRIVKRRTRPVSRA